MEASGGEAAQARRGGDASIIVALGGNLAWKGLEPAAVLEAALQALPREGVAVLKRSRLWRSAAWPDPGVPAFLNAVALVETELDPEALLAALHRIEARFGRRRGETNAPRTLDLDLIAYGRERQAKVPLLPHPRAAERRFVMGPLAEVAPDWIHPVTGDRASELAARATVGADAAVTRARLQSVATRLK